MFNDFLPYIFGPKIVVGDEDHPSGFSKLGHKDISDAEERLGFAFPPQLSTFYETIGFGIWRKGTDDKKATYNNNELLYPGEIADLYLDHEQYRRPPEGFDPNKMPFFEVNLHSFLTMKPRAANPNIVYNGRGQPLGDLEEFMAKLYSHAKFWLTDAAD
jgi:hypothetical protein